MRGVWGGPGTVAPREVSMVGDQRSPAVELVWQKAGHDRSIVPDFRHAGYQATTAFVRPSRPFAIDRRLSGLIDQSEKQPHQTPSTKGINRP